MAAVLPQQASERLPPHLSERLHSSDDEAAWIDRHGEGFRMPASRVERGVKGRRTDTAQARTHGALVRCYGGLRILLRLNEWCGDCGMRFTRGTWW